MDSTVAPVTVLFRSYGAALVGRNRSAFNDSTFVAPPRATTIMVTYVRFITYVIYMLQDCDLLYRMFVAANCWRGQSTGDQSLLTQQQETRAGIEY